MDKQTTIASFISRIREFITKILDELHTRIPGLPSSNVLLTAFILLICGGLLLGAFQLFLAPDQRFTTYILPYEQNFDDVNLRNWFVGKGVWSIRNGTLAQTMGGDTSGQAFIPSKLPEDINYHASGYITLKKDSRAAGLSFNAQYPELTDQQHRVYLSRVDEETIELVSGYMDESGSFVSQVQVRLPVNTTEFRLDLYVYDNSYIVQVNGQRLIDNRPLFYKNGLIGFYAKGPAVFDTFKLTATDYLDPGDMVYSSDFDQSPGAAGWVPFNGTWKISDKQLVQSDPDILNAGIGYETSTFQNFTFRTTFSHISGQGAGVLFNMPSPYQTSGAHTVRFSNETDALIWGYYDAQNTFHRQGFTNLPPPGTEPYIMQIYSAETAYDIFLNDQLIARDIPLQSKQGSIGLITSTASASYSQVEVYPLFGTTGESGHQLTPLAISTKTPNPPINTQTTTTSNLSLPTNNNLAPATPIPWSQAVFGEQAPYAGNFSGSLANQNWIVISGDWRVFNNQILQILDDGYDFAIVYTKTPYKNYSYQVGLSHEQGSGAGLLFNMPYTDRLTGATMVRFSDRRDNALIWGYFNEAGVYTNQGYADVPAAGTNHNSLRVISNDASYSIILENRLIAQDIPFTSGFNAGYIGLVTSKSNVLYDEVMVGSLNADYGSSYSSLDGFSDQRIVSGNWTLTNNTLTQTVPDPSDYIWNTGVIASKYTISSKITLAENDVEQGAGFLIHMQERGTKNNAFLVRLTNGGQGVWWGSTDESGIFNGQGSADLSTDSNEFTMKIIVDQDKGSLFINDTLITDEITFQNIEGWIGLVSYGGPVIFEDLRLDVET